MQKRKDHTRYIYTLLHYNHQYHCFYSTHEGVNQRNQRNNSDRQKIELHISPALKCACKAKNDGKRNRCCKETHTIGEQTGDNKCSASRFSHTATEYRFLQFVVGRELPHVVCWL